MTKFTADDILRVILNAGRPIKAKEIANTLSFNRGEEITRRDVNSVIYGRLFGQVVQDKFFRWSLGSNSLEEFESDRDDLDAQENTVNLDSIVRIKYSRGNELQIGFTKGEDSDKDNIKYISRHSPLAISILGRKVGEWIDPPQSRKNKHLFSYEILEII